MLVRPLSPELKAKAELELNETQNNLEGGIQHLKEWISKQPHLRARTDDQWLAAFLRGCKHSLERTKEKLDLYYTLRTVSPDLFSFRPKNQDFKDLLQTGAMLVLPKLSSPLDPRVIIVKPGLYDPNKYVPTNFISFAHIFQQIMYLEDDAFLVNGSVGVLDFEGITMTHFLQMTPAVLKKLVVAGQDASPLRVKSLHFVNSLPAAEKIFNILIKLLNEKHKKKVNYWLKKLDEYEDWLDEDMKYGTDETKRPGKPKTSENMLGIQGSFRKLDVD